MICRAANDKQDTYLNGIIRQDLLLTLCQYLTIVWWTDSQVSVSFFQH